jgi:hypothetical protein
MLAWLNAGKDNPELAPNLPKKRRIATQLNELGVNAIDKAAYKAVVQSLTDLELMPENYDEISARLAVQV